MKKSKDTNVAGLPTNGQLSEDQIIKQCHVWLWNTYPALRGLNWHIANERKTTKLQGSILKAKGVVAGVPDYVINYKSKTYYVEFKTEQGKQSDSQKIIEHQLNKHGFDYRIIRSFEEFKDFINQIII
jgi:hypothetical protein